MDKKIPLSKELLQFFTHYNDDIDEIIKKLENLSMKLLVDLNRPIPWINSIINSGGDLIRFLDYHIRGTGVPFDNNNVPDNNNNDMGDNSVLTYYKGTDEIFNRIEVPMFSLFLKSYTQKNGNTFLRKIARDGKFSSQFTEEGLLSKNGVSDRFIKSEIYPHIYGKIKLDMKTHENINNINDVDDLSTYVRYKKEDMMMNRQFLDIHYFDSDVPILEDLIHKVIPFKTILSVDPFLDYNAFMPATTSVYNARYEWYFGDEYRPETHFYKEGPLKFTFTRQPINSSGSPMLSAATSFGEMEIPELGLYSLWLVQDTGDIIEDQGIKQPIIKRKLIRRFVFVEDIDAKNTNNGSYQDGYDRKLLIDPGQTFILNPDLKKDMPDIYQSLEEIGRSEGINGMGEHLRILNWIKKRKDDKRVPTVIINDQEDSNILVKYSPANDEDQGDYIGVIKITNRLNDLNEKILDGFGPIPPAPLKNADEMTKLTAALSSQSGRKEKVKFIKSTIADTLHASSEYIDFIVSHIIPSSKGSKFSTTYQLLGIIYQNEIGKPLETVKKAVDEFEIMLKVHLRVNNYAAHVKSDGYPVQNLRYIHHVFYTITNWIHAKRTELEDNIDELGDTKTFTENDSPLTEANFKIAISQHLRVLNVILKQYHPYYYASLIRRKIELTEQALALTVSPPTLENIQQFRDGILNEQVFGYRQPQVLMESAKRELGNVINVRLPSDLEREFIAATVDVSTGTITAITPFEPVASILPPLKGDTLEEIINNLEELQDTFNKISSQELIFDIMVVPEILTPKVLTTSKNMNDFNVSTKFPLTDVNNLTDQSFINGFTYMFMSDNEGNMSLINVLTIRSDPHAYVVKDYIDYTSGDKIPRELKNIEQNQRILIKQAIINYYKSLDDFSRLTSNVLKTPSLLTIKKSYHEKVKEIYDNGQKRFDNGLPVEEVNELNAIAANYTTTRNKIGTQLSLDTKFTDILKKVEVTKQKLNETVITAIQELHDKQHVLKEKQFKLPFLEFPELTSLKKLDEHNKNISKLKLKIEELRKDIRIAEVTKKEAGEIETLENTLDNARKTSIRMRDNENKLDDDISKEKNKNYDALIATWTKQFEIFDETLDKITSINDKLDKIETEKEKMNSYSEQLLNMIKIKNDAMTDTLDKKHIIRNNTDNILISKMNQLNDVTPETIETMEDMWNSLDITHKLDLTNFDMILARREQLEYEIDFQNMLYKMITNRQNQLNASKDNLQKLVDKQENEKIIEQQSNVDTLQQTLDENYSQQSIIKNQLKDSTLDTNTRQSLNIKLTQLEEEASNIEKNLVSTQDEFVAMNDNRFDEQESELRDLDAESISRDESDDSNDLDIVTANKEINRLDSDIGKTTASISEQQEVITKITENIEKENEDVNKVKNEIETATDQSSIDILEKTLLKEQNELRTARSEGDRAENKLINLEETLVDETENRESIAQTVQNLEIEKKNNEKEKEIIETREKQIIQDKITNTNNLLKDIKNILRDMMIQGKLDVTDVDTTDIVKTELLFEKKRIDNNMILFSTAILKWIDYHENIHKDNPEKIFDGNEGGYLRKIEALLADIRTHLSNIGNTHARGTLSAPKDVRNMLSNIMFIYTLMTQKYLGLLSTPVDKRFKYGFICDTNKQPAAECKFEITEEKFLSWNNSIMMKKGLAKLLLAKTAIIGKKHNQPEHYIISNRANQNWGKLFSKGTDVISPSDLGGISATRGNLKVNENGTFILSLIHVIYNLSAKNITETGILPVLWDNIDSGLIIRNFKTKLESPSTTTTTTASTIGIHFPSSGIAITTYDGKTRGGGRRRLIHHRRLPSIFTKGGRSSENLLVHVGSKNIVTSYELWIRLLTPLQPHWFNIMWDQHPQYYLLKWRVDINAIDINTGKSYDPEEDKSTLWGTSRWLTEGLNNQYKDNDDLISSKVYQWMKDEIRKIENENLPFYLLLERGKEYFSSQNWSDNGLFNNVQDNLRKLGEILSTRAYPYLPITRDEINNSLHHWFKQSSEFRNIFYPLPSIMIAEEENVIINPITKERGVRWIDKRINERQINELIDDEQDIIKKQKWHKYRWEMLKSSPSKQLRHLLYVYDISSQEYPKIVDRADILLLRKGQLEERFKKGEFRKETPTGRPRSLTQFPIGSELIKDGKQLVEKFNLEEYTVNPFNLNINPILDEQMIPRYHYDVSDNSIIVETPLNLQELKKYKETVELDDDTLALEYFRSLVDTLRLYMGNKIRITSVYSSSATNTHKMYSRHNTNNRISLKQLDMIEITLLVEDKVDNNGRLNSEITSDMWKSYVRVAPLSQLAFNDKRIYFERKGDSEAYALLDQLMNTIYKGGRALYKNPERVHYKGSIIKGTNDMSSPPNVNPRGMWIGEPSSIKKGPIKYDSFAGIEKFTALRDKITPENIEQLWNTLGQRGSAFVSI